MCRFIAYKGAPITMQEQLFEAKNSLIRQSLSARERAQPVNGDGFGVGWYARELDPHPAVFVSIQPAWNNINLRRLAPRVRSDCFFAHIRDADGGTVTEPNCHPFQFERFLMMHNGVVGDFQKVKRAMRQRLADPLYAWIRGETDSETFFALFLTRLLEKNPSEHHSAAEIADALRAAIRETLEIKREKGAQAHAFLNLAVTNGDVLVAVRHTSHPEQPPHSLYWTRGEALECDAETGYHARENGAPHQANKGGFAMIASERLAGDAADAPHWKPVPSGHLAIVGKDNSIELEPLDADALAAAKPEKSAARSDRD
jgi:glutamine amidotransferase